MEVSNLNTKNSVFMQELVNSIKPMQKLVTTKGVATMTPTMSATLETETNGVTSGTSTKSGKTVIVSAGEPNKSSGETTVNTSMPPIIFQFPNNSSSSSSSSMTDQEKLKRTMYIGGGLLGALIVLLVVLKMRSKN
jgi:hypothetical protein